MQHHAINNKHMWKWRFHNHTLCNGKQKKGTHTHTTKFNRSFVLLLHFVLRLLGKNLDRRQNKIDFWKMQTCSSKTDAENIFVVCFRLQHQYSRWFVSIAIVWPHHLDVGCYVFRRFESLYRGKWTDWISKHHWILLKNTKIRWTRAFRRNGCSGFLLVNTRNDCIGFTRIHWQSLKMHSINSIRMKEKFMNELKFPQIRRNKKKKKKKSRKKLRQMNHLRI